MNNGKKIKINILNFSWFFLRVFLFCLPLQTIFVFSKLKINNQVNNFLSAGLYLNEFFLVLSFFGFLVFISQKQNFKKFLNDFKKYRWLFFIVLTKLVIDLLFRDFNLWFLNSWRLELEMFMLMILILFFQNKVFNLMKSFVYGSVLNIIYSLVCFLWQKDWSSKYFGLSQHLNYVSGASVVQTATSRWLRAYGFFPHPNINAGYSLLIVLFLISLFLYKKIKPQIYYLLLFFNSLVISVSFSRSAVFLLILWLLIISIFYKQKKILFLFLFLIIFNYPLMNLWLTRFNFLDLNNNYLENLSVMERYEQSKLVSKLNYNHFLGVGFGNYVNYLYQELPGLDNYLYQPVHNIYKLFFLENGWLGLIVFLIIVVWFYRLKVKRNWLFFLYLSYLGLGFFDHYLLSLQSTAVFFLPLWFSVLLAINNVKNFNHFST